MSARIIPFPLARRPFDVQRVAMALCNMPASEAEIKLASRLGFYAAEMARRGIAAEDRIPELASYEGAIRAAIWQHVFMGAR